MCRRLVVFGTGTGARPAFRPGRQIPDRTVHRRASRPRYALPPGAGGKNYRSDALHPRCGASRPGGLHGRRGDGQARSRMLGMVTTFISFVAGISLLVGGIGVMNIMLVSVTERTREIGIRKSLGAKTASIMLQFLAEAAILTVIGGLIGILLGVLAAYGICTVMSNSMGMAISPGISPTVVLAATLFSCAVGVFFGIYPARKAAKLSPIEALRRN